jgi:hypothetical protein
MSRAATGNGFLFAVLPDRPLVDATGEYIVGVGRAAARPETLATPSAPTSATGAAGTITGDRIHYVEVMTEDGRLSATSAGSAPLTLATQKATVTFTNPSDTRVAEVRFYASDDAGVTKGYVGRVFHGKYFGADTSGMTGLNDVTFSGTYTGVGTDAQFDVIVSTAAGTDKFKWRKNGGAWSAEISMTGAAQLMSDGISVTWGATTGHTLNDTAEFVSWSNLFSDDVAAPDYGRTPNAGASQVGAELGMRGIWCRSFTPAAMGASDATPELRGNVGPAAYVPKPWEINGNVETDMRAGVQALAATNQLGKPAVYGVLGGARVALPAVVDEPTRIYEILPSTAIADPRSFSGVRYDGVTGLGSDLGLAYIVKSRKIDFENGVVNKFTMAVEAMGASRVGWGTYVSGTGTYWNKYRPVTRAYRVDASRDTDAVYGKITTAPSGGTFGVSFKTGTGSAYDNEQTFTYDTTTGYHIQGDGDDAHYVEVLDQDGLAYGADCQEDEPGLAEYRLPFAIHFDGDCRLLDLDDIFLLPTKMAAVPRTLPQEIEPRLGSANLRLLYGAVAATTVLRHQSGTLEITYPSKVAEELDSFSLMPHDVDRTDLAMLKLSLKRRYVSREFQDLVQRNGRLVVNLAVRGGLIKPQPGTVSTFRRGSVWAIPEMGSAKSPGRTMPGRGVMTEDMELMAYQPTDVTKDVWTETHTTDRLWDFY